MTYHANGKLLLTGEYAVLHGALALALPTRLGQRLTVSPSDQPGVLFWNGLSAEGQTWLQGSWQTSDLTPLRAKSEKGVADHAGADQAAPSQTAADQASTDQTAVDRLTKLLQACRAANPDFLADPAQGWHAETKLEFPRDWGLGSSSTLVHLLSQWAQVDPFPLQFSVFGGSGYDVACAGADSPILYKLVDGVPRWEPIVFDPPFSDRLFFVHLGSKRDSREAMADARLNLEKAMQGPQAASWLNTLVHVTMAIRFATTTTDFAMHLRKHEDVVGSLIGQVPVQHTRFPDFPGVVKSLGGWGGDFVLVVPADTQSKPDILANQTAAYFADKGLSVCLPWSHLIRPIHV